MSMLMLIIIMMMKKNEDEANMMSPRIAIVFTKVVIFCHFALRKVSCHLQWEFTEHLEEERSISIF